MKFLSKKLFDECLHQNKFIFNSSFPECFERSFILSLTFKLWLCFTFDHKSPVEIQKLEEGSRPYSAEEVQTHPLQGCR